MKKVVAICLLAIVGLFLQSASVWAWGEVKKAKENLDMGFYKNAFEILDPFIKKNPGDLDANLQLGRYYLLQGNDRTAIERFNKILENDSSFKPEIGKIFLKATTNEGNKENANCQRIYRLINHAYAFNSSLSVDSDKKLIEYGDMARNKKQLSCAENFYRMAERYNKENIHQTTARRYLHLAALGYRTKELKAEAATIVGDELVRQVFPGVQTIIVLNRTYTYDNVSDKKYGYIYAFQFDKDGIMPNDKVEVIAKPLNGGDFIGNEIWIYRGKNFKPEWYQTIGGYFSKDIETSPKGIKFCVSFGGRRDLKVNVKVTRKKKEEPNLQLLAKI